MAYMLIFLMCLLATSKMSFQTAFGKRSVKNSTDALFFNILVFIAAALFFLPEAIGCSKAVWVYGAFGAVFTVAYQLLYTKALAMGSVSLTVLITNFAMVVNVLASYMIFGEPVSAIRLFAIALTVASFVICNGTGARQAVDKKWLMIAVFAMLSSAFGSLVQKFFGESQYNTEMRAFISCLYIFSATVGVLAYPVMARKEKKTQKIGLCAIKYAVATGVCLALFQAVYNYGIAHIDGTFLFPAQAGGTVVLSAFAGVLIFKDKLTKRQVLGVLVGIVALVLMNF